MIEILSIRLDQAALLCQLCRDTFFESFAPLNHLKDLEDYMNAAFSEEVLTAELHNPASRFYFALEEGKIVGYLKVNFAEAQTELQDKDALELQRIYVSQSAQGKQIGQALMAKAVEIARENDLKTIWLGVWERNEKAILFYEKQGFVPFGDHIFLLGSDAQRDVLMRKLL
jgi:ribosomal protein S18 acetylase RimI-like enzyme